MNTITSQSSFKGVQTLLTHETKRPARRDIILILVGCAAMFLTLHLGLTWSYGKIDETLARIGITVVMVAMAVVFQRALFKVGPKDALLMLGYGRAHAKAILVAGIISVVMLAFFPIFTAVTGAPITIKSDWLWLLLGIAAVQGLAEETLYRGYVFGNMRKLGIPFRRAALISMAVFGTVHLVVFTQNTFIVGFLAVLTALAYAFPFAYLYERGNNTIWAPVLLHVTSSAIRLVDIPDAYYMTALAAWIGLQIITPFLVYAFLGNLLKEPDQIPGNANQSLTHINS